MFSPDMNALAHGATLQRASEALSKKQQVELSIRYVMQPRRHDKPLLRKKPIRHLENLLDEAVTQGVAKLVSR